MELLSQVTNPDASPDFAILVKELWPRQFEQEGSVSKRLNRHRSAPGICLRFLTTAPMRRHVPKER